MLQLSPITQCSGILLMNSKIMKEGEMKISISKFETILVCLSKVKEDLKMGMSQDNMMMSRECTQNLRENSGLLKISKIKHYRDSNLEK